MAYQSKKHRKFVATSVTAALVATAVAPAAGFAAEFKDEVPAWAKDAVDYLIEKGAINGYEDGTFKPNAPIKRGEAAKILALALELDIDDNAKTEFEDAKDHWASKYIAAIQKHNENIINGYEGKFRPNDTITRQEMAKMIVTAYDLKLNEDADVSFTDNKGWGAEYVNILASLGIVEGVGNGKFDPNGAVTRAQTPVFVFRTEVPSERVEVPKKPVTTPEVVSVSADNLKTIVVEFNTAIDTDTLTSDTLKVFEGSNTTATNVDSDLSDGFTSGSVNYQVSKDGKKVTIVFETINTQSEKVRVVVDGVKTANGTDVKKYDETHVVTDVTIPVIENITLKNAKTLEVKVSEPVNVSAPVNQVLANVKINDNAVVGTITQNFAENTLTVKLVSPLKAGNHEITVFDVADYNGLKAAEKKQTVVVAEDNSAPEVIAAKVVSKNVIEIETSEELESLGTFTVNGTSATVSRVDGELTKYRLTGFTLDLSAVVEVTLKYKNQTDVVGNKVDEEKTFVFKAVDDTELPTVTAQLLNESGKKNYVKLTFSKPMQTNVGTIKVLREDGSLYKTISVSSVSGQFNSAKTELELTASDLGFLNTDVVKYKIEISGLKDNTIRENLLAKTTIEVTTVDTKVPTVSPYYVVTEGASPNGDTVKIFFSEAMDETTLSNLSNFTYNGQVLSAIPGAKLHSISADKKSVTFVVPNARAGKAITVVAVKDLNGNMITTPQPVTKSTADNSGLNVQVGSVKATGKRTIEVKFNTPISTVDPSTFLLKDTTDVSGNSDITFVDAKLKSSDATNQTVVLTTIKDIKTDAYVYDLYATSYLDLTKNVYGQKLSTGKLDDVVDAIAPEIVALKKGDTINDDNEVSANKFTIEFSESVNATTATAFLTDLIVKTSDGTLLVPGTDYFVSDSDEGNTTDIDGDTKVVIELADGLFVDGDNTISVAVAAPRNVQDGSTNLLKEFAATTVTVKYVNDAPAAPTAAVAQGTNAGTIKLTGVSSTMEYQVNNGSWTSISGTTVDNIAVNIGDTVKVRVKANGYVPAGTPKTFTITATDITPAAAPNVTADDDNNVIIDIDTTMEYSLDNGQNWVTYDPNNAPDLSGDKTVLVRVKQTATQPASVAKTLTFTANN